MALNLIFEPWHEIVRLRLSFNFEDLTYIITFLLALSVKRKKKKFFEIEQWITIQFLSFLFICISVSYICVSAGLFLFLHLTLGLFDCQYVLHIIIYVCLCVPAFNCLFVNMFVTFLCMSAYF